MSILNFNSSLAPSHKLEFDESPFIYLTSNPKYIDVLCVNCYECVRMLDVDDHSQVCKGVKQMGRETRNLEDFSCA